MDSWRVALLGDGGVGKVHMFLLPLPASLAYDPTKTALAVQVNCTHASFTAFF